MQYVATLITDPALPRLNGELADQARQAAGAVCVRAGQVDWLSDGVACDIPFDADAPRAVLAALKQALDEYRLDVVVQPSAGRRKRLLVADMESTIIVNEMVDELAAYVGVSGKVADITRRAMGGEIDFRPALTERTALLGGLEAELLTVACHKINFMPGALQLVGTMRAHGAFTALITGGYKIFADWVSVRAGFDAQVSNQLLVQDGIITGQVVEPIVGKERKREAMLWVAEDLGIEPKQAVAVGDGANDVEMIAAAGLGVAFRAKKAVADAAPVRIDHGDLTALLYLQGYRAEEFETYAAS